jgi:ribosomal protein L4
MRRLAMKSALSARVAEAALTLVDELSLPSAKTREVAGVLQALGLRRGALIVVAEADEAMSRASRNLEDVRAVTPGGLNLLDVLKYRHVIMTKPAAEALTAQLLKQIGRGGDVAEAASSDVTSSVATNADAQSDDGSKEES